MKWNLHYPGKYIHPCLLWEKISQWWVTFQKKESCHFDKFHASRQAIDNNNPKKKPDEILFYNSTKGGVDQMDQNVRYYSCKRQTKRWPFVLWMNMMDIAAMNSEIMFSVQHPTYHGKINDKRRLFLKDLVEELVKPQITVRSKL